MTDEYKNELIEKLEELEIRELLDLLLNEDNPKTKQIIKNFISENFHENPSLELKKAMKEVLDGNYPTVVKERLTIAKQCVMEVKEHLEIEHVNSLAEISVLVSEIVKMNTVLSEL